MAGAVPVGEDATVLIAISHCRREPLSCRVEGQVVSRRWRVADGTICASRMMGLTADEMRVFDVAKSRDEKDEESGRRRGGGRIEVKIWVSRFEDGGARFCPGQRARALVGPRRGVSGESWGRRAARLVAGILVRSVRLAEGRPGRSIR